MVRTIGCTEGDKGSDEEKQRDLDVAQNFVQG